MRLRTLFALSAITAACSAMQAAGLADAAGEPTTLGQAVSNTVHAATGLDPISLIGLWKALEALLTKRGRQNLVNIVSPSTGFWSSVQSFLAILVGTHSPAAVTAKLEA